MSNTDTIEYKFNLAANYLQSNLAQFNKNDLLHFYAFYKQAINGKCNIPKPLFFNIQERAKWDAWNSLGAMDDAEAMYKYVDHLSELVPDWLDTSNGNTENFGISVSRPKQIDQHINESDKSIQDFIRDGNTSKLKNLLKDIDSEDLNSLDDNGMGFLHWASDRGNTEVLKMLLNRSDLDINLRDNEGQTALFYASSCGHHECLKLLLHHNADKSLIDNENTTCLDVAFDDEVLKILN